jgi:indolepyruvate ferredoxin oxidoreductase alpha subunit
LVVIVADDPGMYSSQNEQDSRFYAMGAHLPMLEPSDSQECSDFIKASYDLSERFDVPVLIRSNTRLSHSRGLVELVEQEVHPLKPYNKDIQKYVMMPGMAKGRHIVVEKRMRDLAEYANEYVLNRTEYRDPEIGIITSGICYHYVREAVPNASILKLGMVHPLPERLIREFASRVMILYVIEELEPVIENQIKAMGLLVQGKKLFSVQGEYTVSQIREKLLGEKTEVQDIGSLPQRPPVLCPGCPHRAVYYMLRRLNLVAMGDIGCYTLGALAPLSAIDTTLCMGASIGMAHGMEKARGEAERLVSVIGDSTFMHSGITGLVNMLYNGATSTVLILDNSTTAMTGHQNHSTTGKTAKGDPAPAVNILALVRAMGVKHVTEIDPFDLPVLKRVLTEETKRRELSVVIIKRACALIDPCAQKPSFSVSEKCRKCATCMKLGCPALLQGEKSVTINRSLCVGCGLCADVCPFAAIIGGVSQ